MTSFKEDLKNVDIDWPALGAELVAAMAADVFAIAAGQITWNRAIRHLLDSDHQITFKEAWLVTMAIRLAAWEWEGSATDRRREMRKRRKRIRDAIKPKD